MKLYPRKGGHGKVTAYLAVIGSKEARDVGFVHPDGTRMELEKVIDVEQQTITIKIAAVQPSEDA